MFSLYIEFIHVSDLSDIFFMTPEHTQKSLELIIQVCLELSKCQLCWVFFVVVVLSRFGVSLHSYSSCLWAIQCGMQAKSWFKAEHTEKHLWLAVCLDLLLVLGCGAIIWLELLRTWGGPDILLTGLGREIMEQLQLSHFLHTPLLHYSSCNHHLLLL